MLDLMQKYDVNSYCQEILESQFIICKEIIDKLDISGVYKKDLHNINTFLMYRKLQMKLIILNKNIKLFKNNKSCLTYYLDNKDDFSKLKKIINEEKPKNINS